MNARMMCAVVGMSWMVSGCGGGSSSNDVPAKPRSLAGPEILLAARVSEAQLDSGYWDFEQDHEDPINYASPGFQNITGVIADGLLSAYARDVADDGADDVTFIPSYAAAAKDALIELCANFVADPLTAPRPSLSNFVFLGRYRDLVGFGLTPTELLTAQAALDMRLSQDNASHGDDPATDPLVVVDGWLNLVAQGRASIPGIIGWDTAFMVKVLLLWPVSPADLDYAVDFLKARPIDSTVDYGLLSAAHVLEVLNMPGVDDPSLDPVLIAAIEARAVGDGSYVDISDPDAPFQATAYVLMAYKEIRSTQVPAIQAWLAGQVDRNGALWNPVTGIENFEADGEALLALSK